MFDGCRSDAGFVRGYLSCMPPVCLRACSVFGQAAYCMTRSHLPALFVNGLTLTVVFDNCEMSLFLTLEDLLHLSEYYKFVCGCFTDSTASYCFITILGHLVAWVKLNCAVFSLVVIMNVFDK